MVGKGSIDGGEPVALFVPTDLKSEDVLHCLGLFDELIVGDGRGLASPRVPVQPPNMSSNKV